jgi:hypothetical protein
MTGAKEIMKPKSVNTLASFFGNIGHTVEIGRSDLIQVL